jgi:hypothetical protein
VQNSVFLHYDNKYFLTLDEHIITIGELDFDLYEQISNSTKIYTKYITQLNFYIHNKCQSAGIEQKLVSWSGEITRAHLLISG